MNKVDISEIVRRSLHEAKKTHGYIVEAEAQKEAPNDREAIHTARHGMPKIALESNQWGSSKSTEEGAVAIETYIKNLRGGSTNSVEDIKSFLVRFNEALGMKMGSSGTPIYTEIDPSNTTLPAIVSSLVLRQAVVSMVKNNKAGTAGHLWEGFVARILGKDIGDGSEIEDIKGVDSDGMLLSLKLIDRVGKVKGSVINLAYGLTRPGVDGIRYLIGTKEGEGVTKSGEEDVFVVRFATFDVTKKNFFQFVIGNPNPSQQEIDAAIKEISEKTGIKFAAGGVAGMQTVTVADQKYQIPPDLVTRIMSKNKEDLITDESIFKYIFADMQDIDLASKVKELIITVNSLTDQQRNDIIQKLTTNETIKAAIRSNKQVELAASLFKEGNLQAILSGKLKGAFTGFFKSPMHTLLDRVLNTYTRQDNLQEREKLQGILNALDEINVLFEQKKDEIFRQLHKKSLSDFEQSTTSFAATINNFWQSIQGLPEGGIAQQAGAKKVEQFEYNWTTIRTWPFVHVDKAFQPIYIDINQMFVSTKQTVNLFREWAEPLYRTHAIMDSAIRKYFGDDDPSEMPALETSVEQTKTHLNKIKVGSQFTKASQLGKQPVQENKKVFTRNYIDDILDDL